jgi:hypothetical protein
MGATPRYIIARKMINETLTSEAAAEGSRAVGMEAS